MRKSEAITSSEIVIEFSLEFEEKQDIFHVSFKL